MSSGMTPGANSRRQEESNAKSLPDSVTLCGWGTTVYPRAKRGDAVAAVADAGIESKQNAAARATRLSGLGAKVTGQIEKSLLTRKPPVLYSAAEAQPRSTFTTEGTDITARHSRNQKELLRVLCASKALTQRSRRVSVTSVFGFLPGTEDTEKKNLRETTTSQELVLQRRVRAFFSMISVPFVVHLFFAALIGLSPHKEDPEKRGVTSRAVLAFSDLDLRIKLAGACKGVFRSLNVTIFGQRQAQIVICPSLVGIQIDG